MGTFVEVTVAHESEAVARGAIREALAEIERVDLLLSGYRSDSVISRVNREAARHPVPVGEDVFRLLEQAGEISAASGGAFDITVLPLVSLWGFDGESVVPAHIEITRILNLVGHDMLIFNQDERSVGFSVSGMGLDLGAIGAGWAADRAAVRLSELGIHNAIVDAGGELRVLGTRPGRDSWRVGIRDPREAGALLVTLALRDTAVATSGDYERFFVVDGVRYHHILDPTTGRPASGCRSVTVLAPTAAEADACSTAAFVLGPERGLAFLRSRPGVRGLIVDAAGSLHWSDPELERLARP